MATNLKLSHGMVALLALCLLPGCSNNAAQAESNLKKLGLLALQYTNAHDLAEPDFSTPATIKADLEPLLAKAKAAEPDKWGANVFLDPVSGQPFVPNKNMAKLDFAKIESPYTDIAFYAPAPSGDKRLVAFMDGHVKWVNESEWPQIKTAGKAD